MKTTTNIETRIRKIPRGKPFLSKSFLGLGTRAAVDQVVARLAKSGQIARVTRGVYVRPKHSKLLGRPVMPSPIEVAQAFAELENATVGVHGAEAARRLGLSTQMPTQPVFISSGAAHSFKLGELKVTVKSVSAKRLVLAGRLAGLAHSALLHMGKSEVTLEVLKSVEAAIGTKELLALESKRAFLPGWLSDLLFRHQANSLEMAV